MSYRLDKTTGSVVSATSSPPGWDPADTPYPEWDANQKLQTQVSANTDTRLILTRGASGDGSDFAYTNLSDTQKDLLDKDAQLDIDACGLERVGYLRGHSVSEGVGTFVVFDHTV